MPHWTEIARQNHQRAVRALSRQVNSHTISVPVGSGDYDAPGWLHLGNYFSCVPDAQYPWDPAVLRAIRVFCPDAVPILVRSVFQWSNYNELGHLGEPMILVRHGMARAVRDIGIVEHPFHCEMPIHAPPGFRIPGRTLAACRPNQIWDVWHDKQIRPWSQDMPGLYLPFDWDYYYALRRGEDLRIKMLRESVRREDEKGQMVARGAADVTSDADQKLHADRRHSRADDRSYAFRDIARYHSAEESEVELKERSLGSARPAKNTVQGAVI